MRLALSIAVALVVVLLASMTAAAQTATPTVIWWQTPAPTETPPVPAAPSDEVVWWYEVTRLEPIVGVWGRSLDVYDVITYSGGAGMTYLPGPEATDRKAYLFVPPANTRAVTATCTASIFGETGYAAATGAEFWFRPWDQALTYLTIESEIGYPLGLTKYSLTDYDSWFYTTNSQQISWRLRDQYASWPGSDGFSYADRNFMSGVVYWLRVGGSVAKSRAAAAVHVVCDINSIERMDGTIYVPPSRWSGEDEFVMSPWAYTPYGTPVAWFATPEAPNVGMSPVMTGCYTLLPSFSTEGVTKYGIPIPDIGWDAVELCTVQHSFDFEWLGFDFGAVIVAMTVIGGFGIIYSRLR